MAFANGYNGQEAQLTMLLSALAYTDQQAVLGESAADQEQRMKRDIDALLASEHSVANQWQVTWGPALDPTRSNMMYVAGDTFANQYAVVVRGTDWDFLLDWLEDFLSLLAPVQYPGTTGQNIKIAYGTDIGLQVLLDMQNSSGQGLLTYLGQLPAGAEIYVTGHSLGGCLATVLAPKVANEVGASSLKVYTFAAPSPGTSGFANYYNAMFLLPDGVTSTAFRVYNDLDVVPNAWATLLTIEGYYQGLVDCPDDLKSLINDAEQAVGAEYAQVGILENDSAYKLTGSIIWPFSSGQTATAATDLVGDILFLWEVAQQHCKWTYYHMLGGTRIGVALTKIRRIAAARRSRA